MEQISRAPWLGYGLGEIHGSGWTFKFLDSVDSLWLVEALRYGLPTVLLMALTIFWPFSKWSAAHLGAVFDDHALG